jgi:hypothetical protein
MLLVDMAIAVQNQTPYNHNIDFSDTLNDVFEKEGQSLQVASHILKDERLFQVLNDVRCDESRPRGCSRLRIRVWAVLPTTVPSNTNFALIAVNSLHRNRICKVQRIRAAVVAPLRADHGLRLSASTRDEVCLTQQWLCTHMEYVVCSRIVEPSLCQL